MRSVHETLALLAVGVPAAAALVGGLAYRRGREPGAVGRQMLALAQTVLIAQVAVGLLLLSDESRAADQLHYAYGTFALLAVLAPWLYAPADPRRRLIWFAGTSLLAGALALRAYMTSA